MRRCARNLAPNTLIASISFPPPQGFSDEVDFEMIEFVERSSGTFDLFGEITNREAFIRYCFAHAEDAESFHHRFAQAAEKAVFRKATLNLPPASFAAFEHWPTTLTRQRIYGVKKRAPSNKQDSSAPQCVFGARFPTIPKQYKPFPSWHSLACCNFIASG